VTSGVADREGGFDTILKLRIKFNSILQNSLIKWGLLSLLSYKYIFRPSHNQCEAFNTTDVKCAHLKTI
jgi:hypothetical protein